MILLKDLGTLSVNLTVTAICASLGIALFNLEDKQFILLVSFLSFIILYLATSGVELLWQLRLRKEFKKIQSLTTKASRLQKRLDASKAELEELKKRHSAAEKELAETLKNLRLAQDYVGKLNSEKEETSQALLKLKNYSSCLEKNIADTVKFFPPNKPILFQELSDEEQSKLEALVFRSSAQELQESDETEEGWRQRYKFISFKFDQTKSLLKSQKGKISELLHTIENLKIEHARELGQKDRIIATKDKVIGTKVNKLTQLKNQVQSLRQELNQYSAEA